jgi:hypothetical protein
MTNSKNKTQIEEQRKQPRKLYLKPVTIHLNDHTISGMIQNISISGVYIESTESVATGQEITITYLGSNNIDEIEVRGKVIWKDHNGFALKYI